RGLARPAHPGREPRGELRPAAGRGGLRAPHRPHRPGRRLRRRHQLRLRGVLLLAAGHREVHRPFHPARGPERGADAGAGAAREARAQPAHPPRRWPRGRRWRPSRWRRSRKTLAMFDWRYWLVAAIWIAWEAYWIISARGTKRTTSSEPFISRL